MTLASNKSNNEIYGNYLVVTPDGEPMFRCSERRANHYIIRDLAEWVDEKTIRLTFEPNGKGHYGDPFHLQERKNVCVCCGSEDDLTRHHVVPRMYRQFIDERLKRGDNHDILPLCIECHIRYERVFGHQLKKKIAEETGIPLHGIGVLKSKGAEFFAQRSASTLVKHGDKIPEDRKDDLMSDVVEWLGHEPSEKELQALASDKISYYVHTDDYEPHGKAVIERMDDEELHAFMIRWRLDFIENMNPQFMPDHWDVARRLTPDKDYPLGDSDER
tara:strand:+ start:100143 stop:100964 length:822 start_codon:yes stop_codon:yes gene_type:complete